MFHNVQSPEKGRRCRSLPSGRGRTVQTFDFRLCGLACALFVRLCVCAMSPLNPSDSPSADRSFSTFADSSLFCFVPLPALTFTIRSAHVVSYRPQSCSGSACYNSHAVIEKMFLMQYFHVKVASFSHNADIKCLYRLSMSCPETTSAFPFLQKMCVKTRSNGDLPSVMSQGAQVSHDKVYSA